MVPGLSRVGLKGSTPCVLTRPMVVLRPVMPHQEAGRRTEPPVSSPDRPRREAGGDGDARAAARAAGRALALRVPRVPGCAEARVGAPAAHGELDSVGLAEHDHALRDEAPGERRGARRLAGAPDLAAAGDILPLDLDEVLEGDR